MATQERALYFLEDEAQHTAQATAPANLAWLWNLMSIALLVACLLAVGIFFNIYQNPASSLNPFPQPTLVPTLFIPTQSVPAAAALPTLNPTPLRASLTPAPTFTPTPTAIYATPSGPLEAIGAARLTPTARVNSIYSFALQAEPRAIASSLFNPARGCDWIGVAGQAFDMRNSPLPLGIMVQVGGVVNGKVINVTSLTGTATQYGPAGYEVTLGSQPVKSQGAVWIRLLDQSAIAMTERIFFDTSADCTQNLMIINFKQIK